MQLLNKALKAIGKTIKQELGQITSKFFGGLGGEASILPPYLTDRQIIDDIRFLREDIANLSPHWNIFFHDRQIARLTERQTALPTYRLERCPKEDWAIFVAEQQEDLLPKLIEWSRASPL
jgi:hypothetical protein